jgi:4-amino-4-deoxychorismate lyase
MWINGQPGESIAATDRGLLYGDGLFETLLIHKGQAILLDRHLQRLQQGCTVLGLEFPQCLLEEIHLFLNSKQATDAVLKIILSRGSGGRGYKPPVIPDPVRILQLHPLPVDIAHNSEQGISVMLCQQPISTNSRLAGLKHLNRLDQVLASMELSAGFDEGLMFDDSGILIEGTRSNVFMVSAGKLYTPDLSRAGVAGIMRSWLIERFARQQIDIEISRISCGQLERISEMFICNSVFGIWPVTRLVSADKAINLPCGPITRQAQHYLIDIYHHE